MEEELIISTIFKALVKPATFMGLDHDYFLIISLIVILTFIYSNNVFFLLIFLPLHSIGWLLTQYDPHIFKLISVRASIGSINNKSLWHCQSYEVF